jgi:EAL domain-containing protein (putative c-di-GMP-specific phosphodiesterase class I)
MTKDIRYKKIVQNYDFTSTDIKNLKELSDIFQQHKDKFLDGFYHFIFNFEYAKKFIKDDTTYNKHKNEIGKWYINLFCGNYDEKYFQKLYTISDVHVKIGLPHHYVNAAFSYVRRFLKDILIENNKLDFISSVDKIIDINLDILTVTYSQNEQAKLIDDIVFIRNSITHNLVIPYYQPIFDAKTLQVSKYESLMRLQRENSTDVVSIFPYLKLAKNIKIYDKLTKIMINKVFQYMQSHNYEFSINLDYEDLSNTTLKSIILEHLKHFKSPSHIIFEIVESEFIDDFKIVEDFANEIRAYGARIAIDDFGSGFSSMENILRLKPEIIKIDGTLIKNLNISDDSKTIVKNIISMTKDLGASSVAEYVHNKEICDICISMGVDFLQGFYLAEPSKNIN